MRRRLLKVIKVCDAIMGSGKSMAAITMFNENPDKKFLYVTPYLEEGRRIRDACPALEFCEPLDTLVEYKYRKSDHALALLEEGRNIVSTHAMLIRSGGTFIDAVKRHGYTLVIDEALDVLNTSRMERADYQLLEEAGYINRTTGEVTSKRLEGEMADEKYGVWLDLLKTGRMVMEEMKGRTHKTKSYMYWQFNRETLEAFRDIYVLTYMFDCQLFKYYLELNRIPYEHINISHPADNVWRFTGGDGDIPEYVGKVHEMIHIIEATKINFIGRDKSALSASWSHYRSMMFTDKCDMLRKDLTNYYRNIAYVPASERMWCTYKTMKPHCKGDLSEKSFVPFNARATNKYSECTALAFCVNVYLDGHIRASLNRQGIEVDEDRYALSVMLQWIWRSAIRNGHEIQLYVPSSRMRGLLKGWMEDVEKAYWEHQAIKEAKE